VEEYRGYSASSKGHSLTKELMRRSRMPQARASTVGESGGVVSTVGSSAPLWGGAGVCGGGGENGGGAAAPGVVGGGRGPFGGPGGAGRAGALVRKMRWGAGRLAMASRSADFSGGMGLAGLRAFPLATRWVEPCCAAQARHRRRRVACWVASAAWGAMGAIEDQCEKK
jgi:hypothetical protein